MGVIDMEAARELVSDAALWPRVRDFIWDFAPQVHPSWLETIPGFSGHSDVFGNAGVKKAILSSLGVTQCFHSFPKDDWSRLLLLDGATLESIAKWLGAIACADSLRRITDGKIVRELKASFAGVYPDMFAYTAYFKGMAAKAATDAKDVMAHGVLSLSDFFAQLDAPLRLRFRLKLPKSLCDLCELDGKEKREAVKSTTMAMLLKLKFQEAHSLCCS